MRCTMIAGLSLVLGATVVSTTRADDGNPKHAEAAARAKAMFRLVDANNDGKISQQEATDAANVLVGGLFFRVDGDGDGKITMEEANKARDKALAQGSLPRYIYDRIGQEAEAQGKPHPVEHAREHVFKALDANGDGGIDVAEFRQGAKKVVEAIFRAADKNGDGQLDPDELKKAHAELHRAAVRAGIGVAFREADADKSGAISRDEFAAAAAERAKYLFRVLDADNDGELTREEVKSDIQTLIRELESMRAKRGAKKAVVPGGPASTTAQ